MKVLVWSGMPLFRHKGCRIHYLLPAALGELGHEVYFSAHPLKVSDFPERLQGQIASHLHLIPPTEIADCLPVDTFLYIDTTPEGVNFYTQDKCPLPHWEELREQVGNFVYICLDYWEDWLLEDLRKRNRSVKEVEEAEKRIVSLSTHITAVSPQLCIHLARKYGREVHWLPNAAPPFFSVCKTPKRDRKQIALIIGGAWYRDLEGVKKLAREHQDWDFFWIGGLKYPFTQGFSPAGNLFLLQDRDPDAILTVASKALVGIIPNRRSWFNYFSDPLKWYIYHVCGLPVVSVKVFHHSQFSDLYPNTWAGDDLERTFRAFLKDLPSLTYPQPVVGFHTYQHRAKALLGILEGKVIYGKATPEGSFHRGDNF